MQARALKNSDLKVTKGWSDATGRRRIFVSLKGLSTVNKIFWLTENDLLSCDHVKDEMRAMLQKHLDAASKFCQH